jgi:outer membrane protein assembly factor BamB
MFFDYGYPEKALAVLEQLTVIEPVERGHWERWISALAGLSDEDRLRDTLRRLLAGVTKAKLSDETLELLRSHLVDSCWRSIASLIAAHDTTRLPEILTLLDTIERTKKLGAEQLWVTWTRGWVLRQSGQSDAAAEAATHLELLAKSLPQAADAKDDEPPQIVFPDGLSMSLTHALALLKETDIPAARPSESAAGPASPPEMRWGFETDGGAMIAQMIPFGDAALFVLDRAAALYKLDAHTGKLVWRRDGLWRSRAGRGPTDVPGRASRRTSYVNYGSGYYGDPTQNLTVLPRIAFDDNDGRLFLCRDGELTARSAQNGEVLWQAELDGEVRRAPPAPGQPAPMPLADDVFLDPARRVIVWRAETATAAAFHPATGKLLWRRDLATRTPSPQLHALNSGASCADGRLLVYGHQPAVLDTATGTTVWNFDASAVREFPLVLKTDEEKQTAAAAPKIALAALPSAAASFAPGFRPTNYGPGTPPRRLGFNHLKPLTERASVLSQWIESKGVLVSPAVSWAEQGWQPIGGAIANGRLLLTMPQLTMALSLDLPLGGSRFDLYGTFVAATGNKAVFHADGAVVCLDMERGTTVSVPLAAVGSGGRNATPEVCLGGTRLYVSGEKGLLCVNPHTQRVVYFAPWPEPVVKFSALKATPSTTGSAAAGPGLPTEQMTGRPVQYHPRFVIQPSEPPMSVALFPRNVARGQTIYVVVAPDKICALSSAAAQ